MEQKSLFPFHHNSIKLFPQQNIGLNIPFNYPYLPFNYQYPPQADWLLQQGIRVYRFETSDKANMMDTIKKLMYLFTKKLSHLHIGIAGTAPLIIIKKESEDANVKEYKSIEEAIADLENDPNVPSDKIKNLKSSLKRLKDKTSIKIRNGEIMNNEIKK